MSIPPRHPTTQQILQRIREIEGVTGPLLCLASAKFTAGKLAGLFAETEHMYDFINSSEAKALTSKLKPSDVAHVWGWDIAHLNPVFNDLVLPATISWSKKNTKADGVDLSTYIPRRRLTAC
jgi:hypothetical protein